MCGNYSSAAERFCQRSTSIMCKFIYKITITTRHLILMGMLLSLYLASAAPVMARQSPGELLRNGTFEGAEGGTAKGAASPNGNRGAWATT